MQIFQENPSLRGCFVCVVQREFTINVKRGLPHHAISICSYNLSPFSTTTKTKKRAEKAFVFNTDNNLNSQTNPIQIYSPSSLSFLYDRESCFGKSFRKPLSSHSTSTIFRLCQPKPTLALLLDQWFPYWVRTHPLGLKTVNFFASTRCERDKYFYWYDYCESFNDFKVDVEQWWETTARTAEWGDKFSSIIMAFEGSNLGRSNKVLTNKTVDFWSIFYVVVLVVFEHKSALFGYH